MTRDQLRTIFVEVLNLDEEVDPESAEYAITEGWDSIAHMALVAELEDTYDVMFETDEVIDMSSFQRAVEILAQHGVELS